ncbi:hypothetical protein Tco_0900022 [Tanacetum coccineum]
MRLPDTPTVSVIQASSDKVTLQQCPLDKLYYEGVWDCFLLKAVVLKGIEGLGICVFIVIRSMCLDTSVRDRFLCILMMYCWKLNKVEVEYEAVDTGEIVEYSPTNIIACYYISKTVLYGTECLSFSLIMLNASKEVDDANPWSENHQMIKFPSETEKTGLKTHEGHNRLSVMPFGLTNAPSISQALMNSVFKMLLINKVVTVWHIIAKLWLQDIKQYLLLRKSFWLSFKPLRNGEDICLIGISKLRLTISVLSTYWSGGLQTPSQMKWLPILMGFDYEILYKKRREGKVADALSRVDTSDELMQILTKVTRDFARMGN